MKLFTRSELEMLQDNGQKIVDRPDIDLWPVQYLMLQKQGALAQNMADITGQSPTVGGFLATHIRPEAPTQICGLLDLGDGQPRRESLYLLQLEKRDRNNGLVFVPDMFFIAQYGSSVYEDAARRNKKITDDPSALVMAAMLMNHRAGKTVHKMPRVTEGPAFLIVPGVN